MDENGLQILLDMVNAVGFPIVLSFYLLHRMESKLDTMIDLLKDLSQSFK